MFKTPWSSHCCLVWAVPVTGCICVASFCIHFAIFIFFSIFLDLLFDLDTPRPAALVDACASHWCMQTGQMISTGFSVRMTITVNRIPPVQDCVDSHDSGIKAFASSYIPKLRTRIYIIPASVECSGRSGLCAQRLWNSANISVDVECT
jgi:hypothetical protein